MKFGLFRNGIKFSNIQADNLDSARKIGAKMLGISKPAFKPLFNLGAQWNDWDYEKSCFIEYRLFVL